MIEAAKVVAVVEDMARLIPFFPRDERGQGFIVADLLELVQTDAELDWLFTQARRTMRDWKKSGGVAELATLLETHRKREADDRAQAELDQKMLAWKREAESEPIELPPPIAPWTPRQWPEEKPPDGPAGRRQLQKPADYDEMRKRVEEQLRREQKPPTTTARRKPCTRAYLPTIRRQAHR
jgi:hypothetical protein